MDGLLVFLGLVVVALFACTLLAVPHVIEGIVHLYAAPGVGALAFVPFGKRDLPASVHAKVPVSDGYRGTKSVTAPGFEEGRWLLSLDGEETRRLRVTVTDGATAFVTVIARRRRPLAHIERALATVRIRLVDVGEGRRLQASILPGNLGLPLAIPGYAIVPPLFDGGRGVGDALVSTLPVTLVVALLWHAVWWGLHHAQIHASVDRAMDLLERQLAD
jgi:hypothetical protein